MTSPLTLSVTSTGVAIAIAGLAVCLILYLAYKLFYRPDFGMPVRRRLLTRGLRVRRDQFADVPLWWSDLQVQRAISGHWKQALRDTVTRPAGARQPKTEPTALAEASPATDWRRAGR